MRIKILKTDIYNDLDTVCGVCGCTDATKYLNTPTWAYKDNKPLCGKCFMQWDFEIFEAIALDNIRDHEDDEILEQGETTTQLRQWCPDHLFFGTRHE